MSITSWALFLSITEAVAQFALKQSVGYNTTALLVGVGAYIGVAMILVHSYTRGFDLSAMQLTWSIMSSIIAVISGAVFLGESVGAILPSLVLLLAAQLNIPRETSKYVSLSR